MFFDAVVVFFAGVEICKKGFSQRNFSVGSFFSLPSFLDGLIL